MVLKKNIFIKYIEEKKVLMLWHAMVKMRRIVLWIKIDNVIIMSLLFASHVYSGAGLYAVPVDGALLQLLLLLLLAVAAACVVVDVPTLLILPFYFVLMLLLLCYELSWLVLLLLSMTSMMAVSAGVCTCCCRFQCC